MKVADSCSKRFRDDPGVFKVARSYRPPSQMPPQLRPWM